MGVLAGRRKREPKPSGYRAIRAIPSSTKRSGLRRRVWENRWLALEVVVSEIILLTWLFSICEEAVG
ncbi:hypothetical protein BDW74DRAFT_155652 [Aspergillus multicolor]|uniref:uncharacterized protein n=1 Tax=Aspergillus multicolor TaxID=41759 RepID=UPI003CCCCCFD